MNPLSLDDARILYSQASINPEKNDIFSSAAEFRAAIHAIDTAIFFLLHPTKKLAKRAAIINTQKQQLTELLWLKDKLMQHPTFIVLQEKEKQENIEKTIEKKWNIVSNDEEFLVRLKSLIDKNDKHIVNKHRFYDTFLERIFCTWTFEEHIFYWDYERYNASGSVLAILDMRLRWWAYIVIINMPYGYSHHNLLLYKLDMEHTTKKKVIVPTIQLLEAYSTQIKEKNNKAT
jgi:hypothetical protein